MTTFDDSVTNELYQILTSKRHELIDFLNEYGSYETLKESVKKINDSNILGGETFLKLLHGMGGFEMNKQSAIYHIPTLELIESIATIVKLFNVNNIIELMAGQGLLSGMLKNKYQDQEEIKFDTTDGFAWTEVYNNSYYCDVKKKFIQEYLYTDITSHNTGFIIVEPDYTAKQVETGFPH